MLKLLKLPWIKNTLYHISTGENTMTSKLKEGMFRLALERSELLSFQLNSIPLLANHS